MTIKLLVAIQGAGGVEIPAGTEVKLSDAVEAAHVSANKAVYTKSPTTFDAPPSSGVGVKINNLTGVTELIAQDYVITKHDLGFVEPEVIYASNVGCPGGTDDDTAAFHAMLSDAPAGSEIILAPRKYTIKAGGVYNKPLTIKGTGPKTEIYFIPDTDGDTFLRFEQINSTPANCNEEGQLYGPRLINLRIRAKREKLAHAIHMYRCDNYHLEGIFVEGIAGASLYLDRSREGNINDFRSRFCGNRESQVPDINIVSVEGTNDTSNYQMWCGISSIFSHWHGIYLYKADKITMQNVMVHQYPVTGTTQFLSNFHQFSVNRFGTDLFQDWLDHFSDVGTGGIETNAIRSVQSSLNIDGIQVIGGTPHKVVLADAGIVHLQNGFINSGSSVDGYLMFADNGAFLTFDNLFVNDSRQIYGFANGAGVSGSGRLGPSFSALQDFSTGGVAEDSWGGQLRFKRDVNFAKAIVMSNNVNFTIGTTTGTRFGTAPDQKISFYGAVPVVQRANAAQAVATDAATTMALANELRMTLITLGLIKGSA